MISFLSGFAGWFLLLTLAVASFLLSLSETAVISTSRIKLRHLLNKGARGARALESLMAQSDRFIVGILVGNNFVNVAFSALITGLCVHWFGDRWGIFLATIGTTFFLLVFCDILPKTTALKNPERMALSIAPLMSAYTSFTAPLGRFFTRISELFLRSLGLQVPKRSPLITEEELRLMIEVGKEEGVLTDEERGMLHRIFEFGDTRIRDVMVPRDKIVAVNVLSSPQEVLDTFVEQGHSRLPVYRNSIDNVIGVVYARDLLYTLRDKGLFVLPDLIHPVVYVTPQMQVNDVLQRFQAGKIQIAVVVDANGRTQGLVTLEDLTEEIVGEIKEQYTRK